MLNINLEKISGPTFFSAFLVVFGSMMPGFLFIFIFDPKLFFSTDIFRLIVLAIAISVPLMMMNALIVLQLINAANKKDIIETQDSNVKQALILFLGSLVSMPVMCISILIGYFADMKVKQGVLTIIIAEIILIVIMSFISFRNYNPGIPKK